MHSFIRLPLSLTLAGVVFLASLGAAESDAGATAPQVLAHLHSAGNQQLTDSDGRVFREILNLPATVQLRDETLDKIAAELSQRWVPNDEGQGTPAAAAALIRPLLTDLCEREFVLEVFGQASNRIESTLLIELNEARRGLWRSNLTRLTAGWKLGSGDQTPKVTVNVSNSWLAVHKVIGGGAAAEGGSTNSALARFRQGLRPVSPTEDYWVKLAVDLARWGEWTGRPAATNLPQVDLTVSGRKEYLRTEARLSFPADLPARLEKWEIPTETIRDPLISFTALQGFAAWIKRQPWFQELELAETPNQLYLWGTTQTAFQIQAAVPVQDARRVLNRLAEKRLAQFNRTLAEYAVGNVMRLTDRVELVWQGLPLLVPYLNTVREKQHEYLHAGIFPVDLPTNAPPPQLFQQLTSQTNLLYYDWEITQSRLTQLRPLQQLATVFLNIPPMSTNSSASKWLDAVEPRLGNTITEVSLLSPNVLQLVRTSHAGLNGLELLTLASWLDATNFYRLNLQLGFRPAVRPR